MASDHPRDQKALGRKVSNFNEETWKENCRDIVKRGNLAKVTIANSYNNYSDFTSRIVATLQDAVIEFAVSIQSCVYNYVGLCLHLSLCRVYVRHARPFSFELPPHTPPV